MFFIILERSYLVGIHTFRKLVHIVFRTDILVAICGWQPADQFTLLFVNLFGLIAFDLLNSGVFRTLPNIQDGAFREKSLKSLTISQKSSPYILERALNTPLLNIK